MSAGFVYILINSSMPGLLKIGRTVRDSRERARELRATGVPTPFELAYEIFSASHEDIERQMHDQLRDFRVSDGREFFRFPLYKAISVLQNVHSQSPEPDPRIDAESIFRRLKEKYNTWLKASLVDVRLVQTTERVWLETTEEELVGDTLVDQTIRHHDLAFISDGPSHGPFFPASHSTSENARRFVDELDPYSLVHTTDIFHASACREIEATLNPHDTARTNK